MPTNSLRSKVPSSIAKEEDGALGDYPRRFQVYLEGQGYARGTVAQYGRCVGELGVLMRRDRTTLADLGEIEAARLLAKSKRPSCRSTWALFMARHFVRFLIEQGVKIPVVTPTPKTKDRDALRQDYEEHLRRQRGLSGETIYHCWLLANRFLMFRFGDGIVKPSKITQTDIAGFLQQLHGRPQPYRVTTTSTHLRAFFQYLFKIGKTKTNLALGIPSVAQRYGSRLRRHLTPAQVETILVAVRSETPIGRRNYAMVLLLARLGLRAPEVVAMQMDDIDWRAGEMIVRGKGQRHDRVPLPPDVGKALAEYIRLDRVTTSRVIFVADQAPHRPFKDGHVLNTILTDAFAKTGLNPPAPYVGSHILRHSLATNLVQRGASLDEIRDLLRHRSRASTMIYAKLDIKGLRSIAPPWPVAGGVK
jgi:integrase/recombinase XerD